MPVNYRHFKSIIYFFVLLLSWQPSMADQIRVAVAANFIPTVKMLAAQFEKTTGHEILYASGSTGKHFAQISNGAPFDVFMAADARRPAILEKAGLAISGTRFTYAIGRLVLWSPNRDFVDPEGKVLTQGSYARIAIANPKLAPYGKAAQQVLQQRKLWTQLQSKILRGENIAQAFQFIISGNAQFGFVALSQIRQFGPEDTGSIWLIDPVLYDPITQQAILLKNTAAARLFMEFVKGDQGRAIIKASGYDVP